MSPPELLPLLVLGRVSEGDGQPAESGCWGKACNALPVGLGRSGSLRKGLLVIGAQVRGSAFLELE